jgi:lysophospholipase L1-like esterase
VHKGGLYLAVGDSTTWTIASNLYPTQIWKKINKDYGNIQYINKGIGGSSAYSLDKIKNMWFLSLPFDLITICVGMNDAANDATTVSLYETSLNNMVDAIKLARPNAEIILCAPNNTTDATRTPYIANYRAKMQQVATAKGTLFCDFSQAFTSGEVPSHTSDGIHPNDTGATDIANLLYPIIQTTNFVKKLNKN